MKFKQLQVVIYKNEDYQIIEILEDSDKDYKISGAGGDFEVLESELTLADDDKQVTFGK